MKIAHFNKYDMVKTYNVVTNQKVIQTIKKSKYFNGVEKSVDDRNDFYDINAKYNGSVYKFKMISGFSLWSLGSEFRKDFKNKYALSEIITLRKYIIDKTIEWLKSNNKVLYLQIRSNKVKDTDSEDSPF